MVLGLLLCKNTLEKFTEKKTDIHKTDGTRMTERELMMYNLIRVVFALPFMVIAGMLAWRCNKKESNFMRILITVLAAMFSTFYILFYLIYRVLLKHPCK